MTCSNMCPSSGLDGYKAKLGNLAELWLDDCDNLTKEIRAWLLPDDDC